jgi:hypothetical protein
VGRSTVTAIREGASPWSLDRRLTADHVGVCPTDDELGPAFGASALNLEELGGGLFLRERQGGDPGHVEVDDGAGWPPART